MQPQSILNSASTGCTGLLERRSLPTAVSRAGAGRVVMALPNENSEIRCLTAITRALNHLAFFRRWLTVSNLVTGNTLPVENCGSVHAVARHTSLKEIEHYSAKARGKRLATEAIERLRYARRATRQLGRAIEAHIARLMKRGIWWRANLVREEQTL